MGKKIVAILLTAAMSMGIAACGGSGDKKDDNTITVWCWDKTFNIFAMEEAAKIYQEDHQDVKIDIVDIARYFFDARPCIPKKCNILSRCIYRNF